MITEKQYNYIKNKIDYVILEDLRKLTKKEASEIIKRNIIEKHPLLQWYVWIDKKNNKKYACTMMGKSKKSYEDEYVKILEKGFLKKHHAEEYHKTKLIKKTPLYIQMGI